MHDVAREQTAGPAAANSPHQCQAAQDAEPLGGDPPCWAHLFEEIDEQAPVVQQVADL